MQSSFGPVELPPGFFSKYLPSSAVLLFAILLDLGYRKLVKVDLKLIHVEIAIFSVVHTAYILIAVRFLGYPSLFGVNYIWLKLVFFIIIGFILYRVYDWAGSELGASIERTVSGLGKSYSRVQSNDETIKSLLKKLISVDIWNMRKLKKEERKTGKTLLHTFGVPDGGIQEEELQVSPNTRTWLRILIPLLSAICLFLALVPV